MDKRFYLTDDRDLPPEDQKSLVIFQGGNGDWYVQVGNKDGRAIEGVRLCTSGGASTACPGLTVAIAAAYRAMEAASAVGTTEAVNLADLQEEVLAWRFRFPNFKFVCGNIFPTI